MTAPRAFALTALLALGACSAPQPTSTASAGAVSGDLTVLAAASLTESFTELGEDFMDANPGLRITFSFGGSSGLAQQIVAGAPADVFAAADEATMQTVVEAGDGGDPPQVFARNSLEIAVPAGNPATVRGLDDLSRDDLAIALCAPQVPCGAAAVRLLDAAGVQAAPDTFERDVRAALTKVRLGEVDAALVYRTDVLAGGSQVESVPVPEATAGETNYPITVLTDAPNEAAARAFVGYVISGKGQQVLADAGFDTP